MSGRPGGISPTIATPCSSSPSALEATIAAITTMSAAGSRGEHGSGEVVGQPAEPEYPRDQEARRDQQRHRAGKLGASGLPAVASANTAAATSADSEPSGPMINCRDDPRNAYATVGSRRA
jgi:hypothetical protein